MYCARPSEAVESFRKAIRLSPRDPMQYDMLCGLAFALVQLGRYEEAVETARRSIHLNSHFSSTLRALFAALAHLDRMQEAHDAAANLLRLEPAFRITEWDKRSPWKHPAKERMAVGLRKGGLPE
jgi:adenylate cyclase